jgi:hypothetical protein
MARCWPSSDALALLTTNGGVKPGVRPRPLHPAVRRQRAPDCEREMEMRGLPVESYARAHDLIQVW